MGNIMFLTHQMSMGYGVSVAVGELSKHLTAAGHNVCVGTMKSEYDIPYVQTYVIVPDPEEISRIASERNIDVILAHTTPFFETLPALAGRFKCWAWEYGDPTCEFFTYDREERKNIIANKQKNVYPFLNGVIAISNFIAWDIGYPQAEIVYCGCDHTKDLGKKSYNDVTYDTTKSLKIGTLMRIGKGEALYKGGHIFLELCENLKRRNIDAEFFIMGRGTKEDCKLFSDKGFNVIRNATDEERSRYLRQMDVFVSPSQWEGFNLPVVEAMRSGTMSMLFDIGAHPEVCPFVMSNVKEMEKLIEAYYRNRKLLLEHSEKCYNFVKSKFTWAKAVTDFLEIMTRHGVFTASALTPVNISSNSSHSVVIKQESKLKKGIKSLRNNGIKTTFGKVARSMLES